MIFRPNRSRMMAPERRRHMRIVTLRNFGWLTIALLIAFAAMTIQSEMRGRHSHDYGRLVRRQIVNEAPSKRPVEVVREEAPAVQARDQAMYVEPVEPAAAPIPTQQIVIPTRGDARVAIVGGPEGVTIVKPARRRLAGGFGR